MPGEIPGPLSEETEAETPEQAAAEEPVRLNEVPAPQPAKELRRWRWPWQRRPQPSEESPPPIPEEDRAQFEQDQRQVERESGQFASPERQERFARPQTPEELVHLMEVVSAEQFRELKLNEKHGTGRIAALRKFLAGERDFDLSPDGRTRQNAWRELARKALVTVFNRKTALAAGTLGVIGILTGGVGLPAAGALFGAIAGRGAAEAWESIRGEERGLREEIAQAHYDQWCELRTLALRAQDETLSEQERAEARRSIVEGFYQTSTPVQEREAEMQEVRQRWDRRRGILSSIGAVAGLGAGIWAGFQGLSHLATRLDLDGDGIYHNVHRINGVWHYAFNNGELAAARDFAQIHGYPFHDVAGTYHLVGPDAARIPAEIVKNLLPEAGRVAGVFAALGLGGIWARRAERGRAEDEEREQARRERRRTESRERLLGQVPEVEASAGETAEATEQPTIPQQYLELAQEEEKSLPEVGKIWIYNDVGGRGILRITNLDWASGYATVDRLDQGFNKTGEFRLELDKLIRKGYERSEFVNDWLLTLQEGDEVRINPDQNIPDRSDPSGSKMVEAETYKFRRVPGKANQAELARTGQERRRVNIFDLAFGGIRPVERERPAERREVLKSPKVNEIWAKRSGAQLPESLRDLPDRVQISEVEDGTIYLINAANNEIIDTPIEDLAAFTSAYRKVGTRRGGGGGGGQRPARRNP